MKIVDAIWKTVTTFPHLPRKSQATMSSLKIVRPSTEAEKTTRTTLDTFEVTPNDVKSWKVPRFQREVTVNVKVSAVAVEIAENDGVIPGIITLGMLDGQRWLIDGQHRREAFLLSECQIGYVDVRIVHAKSMAEMAAEYDRLNSRLVNMKPDDYLRAHEESSESLIRIRKECPFVGYGNIRRGKNVNSAFLSASMAIRSWTSSARDVPTSSSRTALASVKEMHIDDAKAMIKFLNLAMVAWGRDSEHVRLWGVLNMTLCMWLYRRIVMSQYSAKSVRLNDAQFQKCLTSLSADTNYLDWLVGRSFGEVSRAPCYSRMKAIFVKRLQTELPGKKVLMPAPEWAPS